MKNKGFTFVELIVIIGLLALLAIIIVANMIGLQGKQKEKNYNSFKNKFESAACMYIEKKEQADFKKTCKASGCTVNGSALVSSGLVADDLIDPTTNQEVGKATEYNVKISYTNGEKECKFVE